MSSRSTVPQRRLALLLLVAVASSAPAAPAHKPMRHQVAEEVTINAPADVVWARIRNFDAMKDWHPAVEASPADKGNRVGSVRKLKLGGGGTVVETLEAHDDQARSFRYRAKDGGALPVSGYTSTMTVVPAGDKRSTVQWEGTFSRAHRGPNPPQDFDDEAALRTVIGVYRLGLSNLRTLFEGK